LEQMGFIYRSAADSLRDPAATILDVDRAVTQAWATLRSPPRNSARHWRQASFPGSTRI